MIMRENLILHKKNYSQVQLLGLLNKLLIVEKVLNYIIELLDNEKRKFPKENNNLELIDIYLLDKDIKEPAAEIMMAAELIDNYLGDKRFMRELEVSDEYDAA